MEGVYLDALARGLYSGMECQVGSSFADNVHGLMLSARFDVVAMILQ